MADLKTDLAECVRLNGKASPGAWAFECPEHSPNEAFIPLRAGYIECGGGRGRREANAAAITALHNLFHDHGDELLAAVRDTKRLEWLLDRVRCEDFCRLTGRVQGDPEYARAAIDAAIAGRAGE